METVETDPLPSEMEMLRQLYKSSPDMGLVWTAYCLHLKTGQCFPPEFKERIKKYLIKIAQREAKKYRTVTNSKEIRDLLENYYTDEAGLIKRIESRIAKGATISNACYHLSNKLTSVLNETIKKLEKENPPNKTSIDFFQKRRNKLSPDALRMRYYRKNPINTVSLAALWDEYYRSNP